VYEFAPPPPPPIAVKVFPLVSVEFEPLFPAKKVLGCTPPAPTVTVIVEFTKKLMPFVIKIPPAPPPPPEGLLVVPVEPDAPPPAIKVALNEEVCEFAFANLKLLDANNIFKV
jgi:hypothetical protein